MNVLAIILASAKYIVYSDQFFVFCRELSEIEAKLDAMEENSRQMTILERQQVEAQTLVDRAKQELNEHELIRNIDRAKFANYYIIQPCVNSKAHEFNF